MDSRRALGTFSGGIEGWLYRLSRISWIVSSTGTLVKRLSTSNEAVRPCGVLALIRARKLSADLRLNFEGVNGARI